MNFIFQKTNIKEVIEIRQKKFHDNRGYFVEDYDYETFKRNGIPNVFVKNNLSFSVHGVLRGLHFQKGVAAQAKLVRVIQGRVLDVAVDLRPESKTYKKHVSIELSDEKQNMLFIPRGFAHGFLVLSGTATLYYMCDNYYRDRKSVV